jgi:hypothetical protein
VGLLGVAAFPSRLAGQLHPWGDTWLKVERTLGGTLLDLSAVVYLLTPMVFVLACALPYFVRPLRRLAWQRVGPALAALPPGFLLYVLTVSAQEVKSERGSFPTMFDMAEGGGNAKFVVGVLGYMRYTRFWLPALIGIVVSSVAVVLVARRTGGVLQAWGRWAASLAVGLASGSVFVLLLAFSLGHINLFSPAALGDPLTGLVESTIDLLNRRGPATPRELVLDMELPAGSRETGAALMGWPASTGSCEPHPHRRPLDVDREPMDAASRGRKLVKAFEHISQALFTPDDPKVAVFHLSLEGFRADDVHALNPAAPLGIAPFTSGLYDAAARGESVLTSRQLFQAGVRTAHCLGAMTCGLGTLPYNLSFIRDLAPFPVRCTADVLSDAGFHHSFFYGSDAQFDDMAHFFTAHGYRTLVSQAELPVTLPKGTWDGITDFAVFDEAARRTAAALEAEQGPQFSLVMSLSNHSPFTSPQDLPPEVVARVDEALKTSVNRADSDDRLRLVTYSYTDAAVERFFQELTTLHLDERAIVLLMADHSTGHSYVWGKEDPESDAEKTQIPFAIVIPPAFAARARDPVALKVALAEARALLDEAPLSQNDFPTLLLALLSAQPSLAALPQEKRWHTLGGQITSPWFKPGGDARTSILGINGVSELYAFDRQGARVGSYEDSVFLKTRADRYRVTPRLIPVAATLGEVMRCAPSAPTP